LTTVPPVRSFRAIARPRAGSPVNTLENSPYRESLAMRTAGSLLTLRSCGAGKGTAEPLCGAAMRVRTPEHANSWGAARNHSRPGPRPAVDGVLEVRPPWKGEAAPHTGVGADPVAARPLRSTVSPIRPPVTTRPPRLWTTVAAPRSASTHALRQPVRHVPAPAPGSFDWPRQGVVQASCVAAGSHSISFDSTFPEIQSTPLDALSQPIDLIPGLLTPQQRAERAGGQGLPGGSARSGATAADRRR
jgi:hypothetical protein